MDKSENKTLIVKIICLMLSFGLWLYISNVENPLRTYELKNVPVELTNENSLTDSKFAIVNKQQFTVDLKIEGPSSEVIKIKKEDFKITADMSTYALKSGENNIPVQITTCPENINIKNNGFLVIKVNLEEIVQKEFTIKSKVKVTYKDNIYGKEQIISPKKVAVTGGKSSIDRISEAVLIGEEKDVDKDKESDYNIKFMDSSENEVNDIQSDVKNAKLSITVTNGKVIPINLKTTGTIPQGFVLEGYELSKNNINIIGNSQELGKIEYIDTENVDMSSLQSDTAVDVKLRLPEGISAQDGENTIKVNLEVKKEEIVKKEETVTKDIVCNVQYKNLNETFTLETSTPTVKVTLTGTQSELDKINDTNISVILDLSNVKEEESSDYVPQATLSNGNNVTVSAVGSVKTVVKKKVVE